MKRFTATEAKNSLGRVLTLVKNGETVLLTSHGKPVATIVPITMDTTGDEKARLANAELVAEGFYDLPRQKINFADFYSGDVPRLPPGMTAQDLIDWERSGR